MGTNGANTLNGDLGNDTLTGGSGKDTFRFDTALGPSNVDKITDYKVADDTIALDHAVFEALTTTGPLTSTAFLTGAAANDADDRIIYNSATGALMYDADGTGSHAAVRFATLAHNLALTHSDFVVV